MKLRFDQNLSPQLATRLSDVFPGSLHVRELGFEHAPDEEVWRIALARGLAIVTRDADFQERAQISMEAPRIVWIRRGNCSTAEIEGLLRNAAARISVLMKGDAPGFVALLRSEECSLDHLGCLNRNRVRAS